MFTPIVFAQLGVSLLAAILAWASVGSPIFVFSATFPVPIFGASGMTMQSVTIEVTTYLQYYTQCTSGTCNTTKTTDTRAQASLALMVIGGFFSFICVPLTLLLTRGPSPAASVARVALSSLALLFDIAGFANIIAYVSATLPSGSEIKWGAFVGLSIIAWLLALGHLGLFAKEHFFGAPAPAAPITGAGKMFASANPVAVAQMQAPATAAPGTLPPNWVRCGPDPESKDYWYENTVTGESQWDPPR